MKNRLTRYLITSAVALQFGTSASAATGPDLAITVTASPATAAVSDTILYHCVVKNVGTQVVNNAYLYVGPDNSSKTDIYTQYKASNPDPFFTDDTGFKYIHLPDNSIAPGGKSTLDIRYAATADGTAKRLIGVQNQDDPNPGNNSTNVSTTIGNPGITVPGRADPWLANGTSASGGSDTKPEEAPVLVQLADIGETDEVVFFATGSVDYGGATPTDPPDGNSGSLRTLYHLSDSMNGGPENGIAGLNAPANSLVGVFLGPDAPTTGPTPPPFLNFAPDGNVVGSIDYKYLAPDIAQPFFIGDGQTSTGEQQRVKIPLGAARLFLGSMDGSGWYNNSGTFNVKVSVSDTPLSPAHGGLSATTFTVNGDHLPSPGPSTTPVTGLKDTVLHFAAEQTGQPAGLSVRVQATSTPGVESSWTDLPTGLSGAMTYDAGTNEFILNTKNYPSTTVDGICFRAISAANGYPDSISNVVGPFKLTSSVPRAGKTLFRVIRNGLRADMDFRATFIGDRTGVTIRVQKSFSPEFEDSWTDIAAGDASHMMRDPKADEYGLATNDLPQGTGIYFRAIAQGNGADSLSNIVGPYSIRTATPPMVNITSPSSTMPTTPAAPLEIQQNASGIASINIKGTATAGAVRSIGSCSILLDGQVLYTAPGGTNSVSVDYQRNVSTIGDHVIELVAFDDLGATSRAGTAPVYVRVIPPKASAATSAAGPARSAAAASTAGRVFHVDNNLGFWTNPNTWREKAVPGVNDFVVLGKNGVILDPQVPVPEVRSLSINGGSIGGNKAVAVNGIVTLGEANFANGASLIIREGATLELLNPKEIRFTAGAGNNYGTIQNFGTINVHGAGGLGGLGDFIHQGTLNWQLPLLPSESAAASLSLLPRAIQANSVHDNGGKTSAQTFEKPPGSGSLLSEGGLGAISHDGGSLINQDGASLINQDGASIVAQGGGNIVAQGGGNIISQDGASIVAQGGGNIVAQGGGNIISPNGSGIVAPAAGDSTAPSGNDAASGTSTGADTQAATVPSGYVKQGGELDLTRIAITGSVTLEGGVITGAGVITGNLTNTGGYIAPGHSAGSLIVGGNFTQASATDAQHPGGTLILEAGGGAAGEFDALQIAGKATLGGKVELRTINGYKPDAADTINPIGYASKTGSFSSVSSNAQLQVRADGVLASFKPNAPNPPPARLLNISTRLQVQGGDNGLIAGFIITGPAGSTKKVIIRGLGPSTGVAGAISDPILELNGSGVHVVNDNWQQGNTSQIPQGFAPGNPKESVIVVTLTVGSAGYSSYTAALRDTQDQVGIGVAEVYDLSANSVAQLANIATRGLVQTGDNVLIGGFYVGGDEPAKVLVRAIGPALAKAGVTGELKDPMLELHDANGAVISNDNWRETQESEISATGIAPTDERESAILATLVPGGYTAVVRGAGDTTGVAVVEAYNIQ